jgi:hypothetical protein
MPRTSMLALLLFAVPAIAAGKRVKNPDDAAMKTFRLTTDNVRKASAAARRISAEVAKDPALGLSAEKRGKQADTLDAKAKALESDPRIADLLRAESISAREFIMVHMAAIQAGMMATMMSQGAQIDGEKVGDAINPANLEFLETHPDEMDELGKSQEALQKAGKEPSGAAESGKEPSRPPERPAQGAEKK